MRKFALFITIFALVAAACGSDAGTSSTIAPSTVTSSPETDDATATAGVKTRGEPAPPMEFTYFSDDSQGTLADFAGKPIVLNFWASWCPACIAEMPDFQAVSAAFGDQVEFVGIAIQDQRALSVALANETGVEYTLVEDEAGATYQAIGGFAMPTTLFINELGEIVKQHNGTIFADELESTIRELLLNG